jgi:hypothetical protein
MNTPSPISSINKPPINKACKSATEILSSLLSEKSSSQLKPQAIAIAAKKQRAARKAALHSCGMLNANNQRKFSYDLS